MKTTPQTPSSRKGTKRRRRAGSNRAVPPERPAPFAARGRAIQRSPEAALIGDLDALIAAGLVVALAADDEIRYLPTTDDVTSVATTDDITTAGTKVVDLFAGAGTIEGGAR